MGNIVDAMGKKFNIDQFVNGKIAALEQTDKSFRAIYEGTFREGNFTMFEYLKVNRIQKMTYAECQSAIERVSCALSERLSSVGKGSFVGIYGQNSIAWVCVFWALLKCGFKPLLLNTRMDGERLRSVISFYDVGAVVSDSEKFEPLTVAMQEMDAAVWDASPAPFDVCDWADEIAVMSSGTTLSAKLCVYTGENFFYQLCDSANIIKKSRAIKAHYKGELKQLMFLPLYHIFGLAAMFMWFAFFNRAFVVLKDQNPDTILHTIRKHEVTHIFSVPMLWDTVYKIFWTKLRERPEGVQKKLAKGLALVKKTKSRRLARLLMKEVRDNIFGESIRFLISGGSHVDPETLLFFNSIGYHMANGYGMSEIGITSVELSDKFTHMTDGAVGTPFTHTDYRISDKGELLVKSPSMATHIYVDGKEEPLQDGYYNTHDLAREEGGRYFILGRADDVLIGADGENLNPAWLEKQLRLPGSENHALVNYQGEPTLMIQVKRNSTIAERALLAETARAELSRIQIHTSVRRVVFTAENMLGENDFKLNRRKVQALGELADTEEDTRTDSETAAKIRAIFARVLNKDEREVTDNAHFFFTLGGTSLDYLVLLTAMKEEFEQEFPEGGCHTVADFVAAIENKDKI